VFTAVHGYSKPTAPRSGGWRSQVTVQVCVFAFDMLFVDGEMLVHLPLRQRRIRMAQARVVAHSHDARLVSSTHIVQISTTAVVARHPMCAASRQRQYPPASYSCESITACTLELTALRFSTEYACDCSQALPNVKEGFFQLAQSREIASDGAEDVAADATVPDGGVEDPAAADGDAAADRSAPAEMQDRADVNAASGSVTTQKELAGTEIALLASVQLLD